MDNAKLILNGKEYDLPVVVGSEGEVGIDITTLRAKSGAITLDSGYGNTGACKSSICFIDGEAGILRYRGYDIADLAEHASFVEVAHLLIYGDLPNPQQLGVFREKLTRHSMLHEDMKKFYEGYPPTAHPMAVLSSMVASLSTFYPKSIVMVPIRTSSGCSPKPRRSRPTLTRSRPGSRRSIRSTNCRTARTSCMMFAIPCEEYKVNDVCASRSTSC